MIDVVLWLLAFATVSISIGLMYRGWVRGQRLDQRLISCDESLLSDDGFRVTRMVVLPAGTMVIPDAQPVVYSPINQ
ncbi:MAG: hypothetical protein CMA63_05160 [Euryarchaeota archaeon]|nr:hypothetical protein [Euryarchaeota archaeon]